MTKCINFELSKRLNDLGLLDNIETEYAWTKDDRFESEILTTYGYSTSRDIKTLTPVEAIDIILKNNKGYEIVFSFNNDIVLVDYNDDHKFGIIKQFCYGDKTKNIEKCLEYLISNNLLGKQ